MLQTLKNAWRTKEIRSKILFTLFIVLLYRIGTVVPVPFVNASSFQGSFQGTILDYMNLLSGGSLGNATLFALGVSPYINASIIIQLLAVVFPNSLGEMAKNDKKKMAFITRIVTVVLAIVTSIGYYFLLKGQDGYSSLMPAADPAQSGYAWIYAIVIIACYCAGATLVMWLAERVNEHGIGNGISIILFANIVSTLPSQVYGLIKVITGTFDYVSPVGYAIVSIVMFLLYCVIAIALVAFVVYITGSERRIPVQYAKRVVGRKMYGGQSSNLPIKLNMNGVMPVIFASSIVSLVPTILTLCGVNASTKGFWGSFYNAFSQSGIIYPLSLFILIIAFAYFYTQITFDPIDVANNLKKQGGAIPGIRQGRPTSDYIRKILNKITLVGALFLSVIAVLPVITGSHIIDPIFEWIINGATEGWTDMDFIYYQYYNGGHTFAEVAAQKASSLATTFTFGGTSLIIVVGVALETFRELEAQLTMRNYKGFLN